MIAGREALDYTVAVQLSWTGPFKNVKPDISLKGFTALSFAAHNEGSRIGDLLYYHASCVLSPLVFFRDALPLRTHIIEVFLPRILEFNHIDKISLAYESGTEQITSEQLFLKAVRDSFLDAKFRGQYERDQGYMTDEDTMDEEIMEAMMENDRIEEAKRENYARHFGYGMTGTGKE